MSHAHSGHITKLSTLYREASTKRFHPLATIRCSQPAVFLTQEARDLGCLLDVDEDVVAWSCLPREFDTLLGPWVPDFLVDYSDGRSVFLDVCAVAGPPEITEAIACRREIHRFVSFDEIASGHRLENARDLLRNGTRRTPLNDRVRLLAAIAEAGSLTVAESLGHFSEIRPMSGLAWLFLHRFISIDLDDGPIGPDTRIRKFER